ncbi:MAG: T9SS type A sorting domain-containing protein [Bacteroidales bacterium]|nr:T9SS type A sorting domain-containing protein [Bacteroidales bacterium]
MEVRLDAIDGPLVATLRVPYSETWGISDFVVSDTALTQALTGTHDVYLVGKRVQGDGGIGNFTYIEFVEGTITSIQTNVAEHKALLYPNPAATTLYVKAANQAKAEISIFNSVGQLMKSVVVNSELTEIDVTGLSKGVFFLDIQSSEGRSLQKFVVN